MGKHNIPPLNEALLGMCHNERRRVGILIRGMGKVFYDVTLSDVVKNHSAANKNNNNHGTEEEEL